MSVADVVTSEGNAPYCTVCRLVERAPKRILQYNVVPYGCLYLSTQF